jgi:hypothetical protein
VQRRAQERRRARRVRERLQAHEQPTSGSELPSGNDPADVNTSGCKHASVCEHNASELSKLPGGDEHASDVGQASGSQYASGGEQRARERLQARKRACEQGRARERLQARKQACEQRRAQERRRARQVRERLQAHEQPTSGSELPSGSDPADVNTSGCKHASVCEHDASELSKLPGGDEHASDVGQASGSQYASGGEHDAYGTEQAQRQRCLCPHASFWL